MELPAKYDPALTEDKWYAYWLENGFFHSEPDEREPYTIVIPPPNVTGILHMGHVLNNTLNDVLIRKARMPAGCLEQTMHPSLRRIRSCRSLLLKVSGRKTLHAKSS